jgi:hypothetical protein
MRPLPTFLCIAAVGCIISTTSAAGTVSQLPKLPNNDVAAKPPKAGVTFGASLFPLAVRITTPDGSWLGGQGEMNFPVKQYHFGWLEVMQSSAENPLGLISMIASYNPTGSVAATVQQLRAGGLGNGLEGIHLHVSALREAETRELTGGVGSGDVVG